MIVCHLIGHRVDGQESYYYQTLDCGRCHTDVVAHWWNRWWWVLKSDLRDLWREWKNRNARCSVCNEMYREGCNPTCPGEEMPF